MDSDEFAQERAEVEGLIREAFGDSGYKIIMPDDGWDLRIVSYYCPFCAKNYDHESIFLNLDMLINSGMTQSEFFLELHYNESHTWNGDDDDNGYWSA